VRPLAARRLLCAVPSMAGGLQAGFRAGDPSNLGSPRTPNRSSCGYSILTTIPPLRRFALSYKCAGVPSESMPSRMEVAENSLRQDL
jgi:hypothetical protein